MCYPAEETAPRFKPTRIAIFGQGRLIQWTKVDRYTGPFDSRWPHRAGIGKYEVLRFSWYIFEYLKNLFPHVRINVPARARSSKD
jgi:hypothetical protein